ncbi:hypothetical protein L210DRAFT_3638922 [Boletus edulis BED1]|uniref:Uncharacterized protein n=1 Tax=Boletus edulis BED1 TaxID=1328754 RepID=A0AAD4C8G2_BOLED|nr:hypothetical protein L210DRAFT_3638922 [Boletus edulis BED1]
MTTRWSDLGRRPGMMRGWFGCLSEVVSTRFDSRRAAPVAPSVPPRFQLMWRPSPSLWRSSSCSTSLFAPCTSWSLRVYVSVSTARAFPSLLEHIPSYPAHSTTLWWSRSASTTPTGQDDLLGL